MAENQRKREAASRWEFKAGGQQQQQLNELERFVRSDALRTSPLLFFFLLLLRNSISTSSLGLPSSLLSSPLLQLVECLTHLMIGSLWLQLPHSVGEEERREGSESHL
jgi:hypothetical protein